LKTDICQTWKQGIDERSAIRFPAETRDFSLLQNVQNISGTYTSPYLIVTENYFPEGKEGGTWM
jgi:hypothetical protein